MRLFKSACTCHHDGSWWYNKVLALTRLTVLATCTLQKVQGMQRAPRRHALTDCGSDWNKTLSADDDAGPWMPPAFRCEWVFARRCGAFSALLGAQSAASYSATTRSAQDFVQITSSPTQISNSPACDDEMLGFGGLHSNLWFSSWNGYLLFSSCWVKKKMF